MTEPFTLKRYYESNPQQNTVQTIKLKLHTNTPVNIPLRFFVRSCLMDFLNSIQQQQHRVI